MSRAKVIQTPQKDFLQDKNIYNGRIFFFRLLSLSIPQLYTDLLHHTHLVWLHLDKIGLLHHKLFSKSF